jgi:anti-sigma factor RsiW
MNETNYNLDDELLSAYIDGELTDAERAAVDARLETDAAARELVAQMRNLSGSLKSLPREALADDLRGAVLQQIGDTRVSLPSVKLSMAHRLMWPAIAIAAALLLMFVQGNERSEVDKVASVDGRAAERRGQPRVDGADAAFEAPAGEAPALEAAAAPGEPSAGGELAMDAEPAAPPADAVAGTVLGDTAGDVAVAARPMTEALAQSNAELEGVVHLTLTDFRAGTERFNHLLISNGVQLVDELAAAAELASAAAPATAPATTETFGAGGESATLATRSAGPAGGRGGTREASSAGNEKSQAVEPEMVLVEAPPEQIEQILLGCAQDTEAIEEITVDPTASGMNNVPAQQRLSDYQQYSRSSSKLALGNEYKVTPEQQNAIAVLNSVPRQAEPPTQDAENQQQQGWAARFYAGQQPVQKDQINWQYNRYRHQYFDNQIRQQQSFAKGESVNGAKELAKENVVTEQPVRVLFLLHPSQEPAKK